MLAKPVAFLQRDFRIAMTYRIGFIQSIVALILGLISLNFIATFVDEGAPPTLDVYNHGYFGFALVGTAVALFAQGVVGLFPSAVRSAQTTGTLEVILGGRTEYLMFLSGSAFYGFCYMLIRFAVTLLIGSFILQAQINPGGVLVATIALLLTGVTFAGIGILGAAFVVWFKQQEPLTGMYVTLSLLLGGVLYPTTVLPNLLQKLAAIMPLTHTVDVMRLALLQQHGISAAADDLAVLSISALLLPFAILIFAFAVGRARASGSLGHH
jgi:ABC-type polysaccharide/polyol phosphate export permease